VAAHLGVLALLLTMRGTPPKVDEPAPMVVQLAAAPQADPVAPPTPEPPPPAKAPPPRNVARQVRSPPPDVRPLPSGKGPSADGDDEASDAQVASAATAGSGVAGRCDMARQLQAALRRNGLVQAAVAEARAENGHAMFVWNGDWVRSHGQDGAGLAAVREAIMWEIAFAPEACRAQPVHGLVLLSLNDGPGAGRLVMGQGDWRWSDMLRPR
jgi:outer membrane biosynthesis protein TonB